MLFAVWSWNSAVDATVGSGFVVALASVCLIHYVYRMRSKQQFNSIQGQLSQLEYKLRSAVEQRSASDIENELLRDFWDETHHEGGLHKLLQQLVHTDGVSWAMYIDLQPTLRVRASRGLQLPLTGTLQPDPKFLERLAESESLVLEGHTLLDCGWLRQLSPLDRDALQKMYVFRVGTPDAVAGVLLTTHLIPRLAPEAQQLDLMSRLLPALGRMLLRITDLEERERRVKQGQERAEIRSILDAQKGSGLETLNRFLHRLQQDTHVERATLFLVNGGRTLANTPFACAGESLPPGIRETWLRSEVNLALTGLTRRNLRSYDASKLSLLNIPSIFGSAAVVPVSGGGSFCGVLCFTRRDRSGLNDKELDLIGWAAEVLGEKLQQLLRLTRVERQASVDGLTQLNNRRTFDQELARELQIAHATSGDLSLMMIDIDRFKSVNDTYGHQGGDHVLRRVAALITDVTSQLRAGDRAICARYGGEEMAIIFPGMSINGALRVGELIRSRLEQTPMEFEGKTFQVTLSAGVAQYPEHGHSAEEILSSADAALYVAKQSGRNRILAALGNTSPVVTETQADASSSESSDALSTTASLATA